MTKELLKEWLRESPENAQHFAEEGFILEAAECVYRALETKGLSKAELANALGKSKAYVSQLLNGSRNMTLRTFADIAFALDMNPSIALRERLPYGYRYEWETGGEFSLVQAPRRFSTQAAAVRDVMEEWSEPLPLQEEAA